MTQEEIDALPDTLVIPLRKPLTDPAGGEVSEIKLREPTAGEIEQMASVPTAGSGVFSVHLIAGLPQATVRQIPAREFNKAQNYILGFMQDAQPTGAAS